MYWKQLVPAETAINCALKLPPSLQGVLQNCTYIEARKQKTVFRTQVHFYLFVSCCLAFAPCTEMGSDILKSWLVEEVGLSLQNVEKVRAF